MAKREFLMLAHNYKPEKHGIAGWYMSEKLDGMRCFWDGGITRGMAKSDVPWANQDKDGRYVSLPIATGLWSRYGNIIHAPDDWLDQLPKAPMDGELYAGLGHRQHLMSTIKKLEPNEEDWDSVKYHVFDLPSPYTVFADSEIKTPNFNKKLSGIIPWFEARLGQLEYLPKPSTVFTSTIFLINKLVGTNEVAIPVGQEQLPFATDKAEARIGEYLHEIAEAGGEGLMLRAPGSYWKGERSHSLVKVKKLDDMEGTVIGYTTGRETDKGSKLLGMMGALIIETSSGIQLELSGFTDFERMLDSCDDDHTQGDAYNWAALNTGEEVPEWIEAQQFPRGSTVTFRYRGLTADGVPMEARYWRKRD